MNPILCWIDIPVTDLDRAITFYSAVLGVPIEKQEVTPTVQFGVFPGSEHGPSGCLVTAEDNQPSGSGPLVYLSVEGRPDEALRQVTVHGGSVIYPKHEIGPHGHRAVIHDSEGNRIALHSVVG